MREPMERLRADFRWLSDDEKREFLERLEEEGSYRAMIRRLQQERDNPQDDAYNAL